MTWYTYRWLIEHLHYILKGGCKLDERQLREAQRLEGLLAVNSVVAWRLLWLIYQARLTPDVHCTIAPTDPEWPPCMPLSAAPPCRHPPCLPSSKPQLGEFLGRKGDGQPGVKVLWHSWSRLQDITATWLIAHPPSKHVGNE